jgi:hypothetical protein
MIMFLTLTRSLFFFARGTDKFNYQGVRSRLLWQQVKRDGQMR